MLAGGRVLRTGAASQKNVAGYDLTRLFVGLEGTLGMVTEATVRLVPVPRGERVTFQVAFPSIAGAGVAVVAVMVSPSTPELLELVDRVTGRLVEEFAPSGLDTNGAATLIGEWPGDRPGEKAPIRGGPPELYEARARHHPPQSTSHPT